MNDRAGSRPRHNNPKMNVDPFYMDEKEMDALLAKAATYDEGIAVRVIEQDDSFQNLMDADGVVFHGTGIPAGRYVIVREVEDA